MLLTLACTQACKFPLLRRHKRAHTHIILPLSRSLGSLGQGERLKSAMEGAEEKKAQLMQSLEEVQGQLQRALEVRK